MDRARVKEGNNVIGMSYMRPLMTGGGVYLLSGVSAVSVWRSAGAAPSGGDLLFWLVGFPTAIVGGVWLFQRWRNGRTSTALSVHVTEQLSPAQAKVLPATPGRASVLAVLASATWLPAGRDVRDIVDAVRRNQRPSLHPSLRDLHGFPAFVANVEGLDEADSDWVLESGEQVDFQARAFAMLRPVAEELLLAALPDPPPDRDMRASENGASMHPYAMHHSQSAQAPSQIQRATLHVVLLTPAHWSGAVRSSANNALSRLATSLGHDPDNLEIMVHPVHGEADAWQLLSHVADTMIESPVLDDRALVLAVDSWVSESVLEQLHADERLLRSDAAEGEVPGEGAAGLLLAAAAGAHPDASATEPYLAGTQISLHLPHQTRLADACRPRDAARITAELIARALDTAGCTADAPLQVVTGADHRPSRMVEAATALVAQRPELDPVADALHLGVSCGSLGVTGPLALLAVAAAHARETETTTLALALADATTRAAAVLVPATHDSLSPAAAAAAA